MFESLKTRIAETFFGPNQYDVRVRRAIADMARLDDEQANLLVEAMQRDVALIQSQITSQNESLQPPQAPKPLIINGAFAMEPAKNAYNPQKTETTIQVSIFSQDLTKEPAYELIGKPFGYPTVGLNFPTYLILRRLNP